MENFIYFAIQQGLKMNAEKVISDFRKLAPNEIVESRLLQVICKQLRDKKK